MKVKEKKEIEETLRGFGLSDRERDAYLALLSMGPQTATPLATTLGVPLTTAQSVLVRLDEHGVVEVTKRRSRSVYAAKEPTVFKRILEERLRDVSHAIPLLNELKGDAVGAAAVRVFRRERMTEIWSEALDAKDKLVHEIVAGKDVQAVLGERYHFTRRRVEKGVRLRSLRVESREIKKYSKETHAKELREAKFLPKELTFRSTVMFWGGDMTAFIMPKGEDLAIAVRSAELNRTARQIFDLLWSVSRKMETA